VLAGLSQANSGDNARVEQAVHARVRELCRRFPIYPGL
jgi:glycine hydroxymethyltransferase